MSNFKSDLITANDQMKYSDKVVDSDRVCGLLLLATASYTLLGTEAANDTIQLADLPAGAVVVTQLCHVTSADPGTALTLDIGDALDPNRYADTVVLSAGGEIKFNSGTLPAAVVTPYRPAATSRVYATVKTSTTLTAGVVLMFTITYRIKG